MSDEVLSPASEESPAAEGSAAPTSRMRTRLARIGSKPSADPVLEPLFRIVRNTHPKADLSSIEKAYKIAEHHHRGQKRISGDPYITHPLAVTIDPRRARHDAADAVRCAAARHRRGHRLHPRQLTRGLRRRGRPARRRRHEARQGQARRLRAGRDHPQDDRRDEQGHPRPRHQARRPAAQHAHAALPPTGQAGADRHRDARDLRAAGAPARHEHASSGSSRTSRSPPCIPRSTTRSSGWSPSARRRATSSWRRWSTRSRTTCAAPRSRRR